MTALVTYRAVSVYNDVPVRIGMACGAFPRSYVFYVAVGAVQCGVHGRVLDELLLGLLVAEHTLLTRHDRTELDGSWSMWVVTCLAISQSVPVLKPMTLQTVH